LGAAQAIFSARMPQFIRHFGACFAAIGLGLVASQGQPLQRVPNTTLQLPVSPPGYLYASSNALGTLTFTNPVVIVSPPSETNRLFIVEKRGRIVVVTNLAAPTRTIFMDIDPRVTSGTDTDVGGEEGLLGLAFHPGYATNRFFYVFYTGNDTTSTGSGRHDILSRFTTDPSDPNNGLTNSEVKLIRQRDEASNHNGGDLHFGPDGYLYVSLGDEGGGDDSWNNSQRITNDFFSGILRIDVDKRPGSLNPNPHAGVTGTTNYAIPPDNPFLHTSLGGDWNGTFNGFSLSNNLARVRTEFWAVGLRNPWRMSFDRATGWLYCGDVGQGAREELDIIVRGANYGWAYREGTIARPGSSTPPPGFTHVNPILDYGRGEGSTIIGGVVYRGQFITPLFGAHIFADYGSSGQIWMTRYNGTNATAKQLLVTDTAISAFGVDPRNGDVLYADLNGGINSTIDRIIPTSPTGQQYPTNLALTGAFADLTTLTPNPGIVAYDLNLPFWSDNAIKTRWFSLPNTNLTMVFNREGNWSFPTGAVWIKHFDLELTNGVPESRRRLETRFIVKYASGVYGITYRWGNSLTNATLVPENGLDETFVINEGGGILRTQVWHYPSRAECLQCHTAPGGFALGFSTAQLNRDFDYAGAVTNQISALSQAGYFNTNVTGIHTLRSLFHPTNDAVSLEYRVRSYLAANCAQCHQPGGTSQGIWDARLTTTTPNAGIINGELINNAGNPDNRVIAPGSLTDSMMLARITSLGAGRMPPLATTVLDTQAINLLCAWITNDLPSHVSFADWQVNYFGGTNAPDAGPNDDADGDGAKNYLEYLTQTNPTNSLNAWRIFVELSNSTPQIAFPQIANRAFEVQTTPDLNATSTWSPLDVSGNQPVFASSNRTARVSDTQSADTNKFYRVRVYEP
jgi:glucose/arabinose dehydrogenase